MTRDPRTAKPQSKQTTAPQHTTVTPVSQCLTNTNTDKKINFNYNSPKPMHPPLHISFYFLLNAQAHVRRIEDQSHQASSPTFRVFKVRNLQPTADSTLTNSQPDNYDPRIDYASREAARKARRHITEDPLEAKLREIFRSPKRSSPVT